MADKPRHIGAKLPKDAPLVRKLGHELIEFLPIGVYLCNAEGHVTTYNSKVADIWGESPDLTKAPIKYSAAYRLLNEDGVHIPHDQSPLAAVFLTQKAVRDLRLVVERRDGSQVPIIANIVPLFDSDGAMVGFMNSVQDLRQLAAQEQARDNLQSALLQSQKMEQLGNVDGTATNIFIDQLTTLSMGLSLMEKEIMSNGSEQLRTYFAMCKEAADRAAAGAEDLLLFARSRPRSLERIDPNQVLLGMSSLISNEVGEQTAVDLKLASDTCFLKAHRQHLESAIVNLIVNAREAMPHGGVLTLSTFTANLDRSNLPLHNANFRPGRYTAIVVTDTGIGIPPQELEHVLTPFYTTKQADKSMGLGLTMVRGFVTDMNGQMTIESKLGLGTSIHLYFPCYGTEHSLSLKGSEQH